METDSVSFDPDALYLVPLGGTGEIGMNLNLYAHQGAWLIVDLGITFADRRVPGAEVITPDPVFIEERRDELVGIVLTHAHEDHIGAVPYLWSRLRCPIYATAFTAALVRRKLAEAGLESEASVTEIPLSGKLSLGPFRLEFVTLTHSIPEPNAVLVETDAGTVLHTGDWKLDPDPVVGDDYDRTRLEELRQENILAMVCDSTNALVDGDSGSEAEVRKHLIETVGRQPNRVAIACFASNVARLESALRAAQAHGRRVALVGRSMHRIVACAVETGYLTDVPPFVDEDAVEYLPRDEVLLLCTGSQGEPRSALWRIANEQHGHLFLDEGDTAVFSSRVIPGNETAIFELQNALVRKGIEVITDDKHYIHVSGHPCRDELIQMYQWVHPRISVPVHGEARHLAAHAALARECQVPEQIVTENGGVVRLAPGPAKVVGRVPVGRLAFVGSRLVPVDGSVIRDRMKIMYNGSVFVTVVIDENGRLDGEPDISFHGVSEEEETVALEEELVDAMESAIARLKPAQRKSDQTVGEIVRTAVRRTVNRRLGSKPVTRVHVIRLEE